MFFRCIALCQTVLPDRKENPSPDTPNPHFIYHGSSPDEEALVAAAADLGVVFKARASDLLQITVCGLAESYKVLQVFEFSSDRKRMSILVQKLGDAAAPPASTVLPSIVGSVDGQPTTLTMSSMGSLPPGAISTAIPAGRVLIFTKGADDVIFEACKGSTARERLVATNKHLELFAQSGYRTLCMAFREVPDVEYKGMCECVCSRRCDRA